MGTAIHRSSLRIMERTVERLRQLRQLPIYPSGDWGQ